MATTTTDDPPAPTRRAPGREVALWTAAAVLAALPWGVTALKEHSSSVARQPEAVDESRIEDGSGRANARQPALSPDGRRIAFTASSPAGTFLYAVGADGTGLRRLAADVHHINTSAFTPDGRQVLYVGRDGKDATIRRVGVDGRGAKRLARLGPAEEELNSFVTFSPDGRRVVYARPVTGPCTGDYIGPCEDVLGSDLYIMNVDGSDRRRLTGLPGSEEGATFSRDGSQIAFTAGLDGYQDELPPRQIHVVGVDGEGLRQLTHGERSAGGPAFLPDGTGIAYYEHVDDGADAVRAVGLDGAPLPFDGTPRPRGATPDWSRFAWVQGPDEREDVYVQDAGSPTARRVTDLSVEPDLFGSSNL